MHPTVAHELARSRIADFHRAADADRRVLAARKDDSEAEPTVHAGSRWGDAAADPTGLVRRLLGRLRPAVAP
jgi:hypothetical protein